MYIRKTTHKNRKNGRSYFTYKLVESIRTERGPRQRMILNLGTELDLPQEEWSDLAHCIEDQIHGTKSLISFSKNVQILAQKYSKLVLKKESKPISTRETTEVSAAETDDHNVDLNSLKHRDVRTVGAENLVLNEAHGLELVPELSRLGFNKKEINLALGTVISRAVYPGSERRTFSILQNNSSLDDLLATDFNQYTLTSMYKISDRLLAKKKELEKYIYEKAKEQFQLTETIVLYDLTNTYFEGTAQANAKAKRGRSKEKRSDCPLVTLGLVLDEDGFCKKSDIFAGNISEPKTLAQMIEGLKSSEDLSRPIIVMDAGIATEKNLEFLKNDENRYDYVVVSRKAMKLMPKGETTTLSDKKGNHVKAVSVFNKESNEMELYCHSEAREQKEKSIKTLFQTRFEVDLTKLSQGLKVKGRLKNYDKIKETIGRLKEKYKKVSFLYEINVKRAELDKNAESICWKKITAQDEKTLQGIYCLRTTIKGFDEKRLWKIYLTLTGVESAFRSMKSELGMRPIFHQKETQVDGHLFITVLAYHLVHSLRFQLKKKQINDSWPTIRDAMSSQVRATIQIKNDQKKLISIRKTSEPNEYQKRIYQAIGISKHPGITEKTIL